MPEGDTIFRAARTLQRVLAGHTVTRFESVYPALTRVDVDRPLVGRTIDGVRAHGKHLLMQFSGDLVLHTHMRMNGSWHLYRPGERWRYPFRDMRVVVETAHAVAVGFNIPVAEFLTSQELQRHALLQSLGPDLAGRDVDRAEVVRRMAAHGHEPIHEVLLNQRVVSGIGNELKSEVLFVARVDPFARTGDLDEAAVSRLLDASIRLMRMNITEGRGTVPTVGRRTTGSLNPRERVYVYGRAGKPCRRCGTPVEVSKAGRDARLTYWCPACQPSHTERPREATDPAPVRPTD